MFECSSLALYERFERKQGISSLLYLKCSTVAADIFKNSSFQQKYKIVKIDNKLFSLCDHQLTMVMQKIGYSSEFMEFKNLIL